MEFLLATGYQQQQIISVNMEKFETSSTTMLTSLASTFDTMTQVGDFTFIANIINGFNCCWLYSRFSEELKMVLTKI